VEADDRHSALDGERGKMHVGRQRILSEPILSFLPLGMSSFTS
jgi:hypothetical protein